MLLSHHHPLAIIPAQHPYQSLPLKPANYFQDSYLNIARQGEVFPERMSLKAIVC